MKPKISVIIPAYNAAHFLERSLARVFRQSVPAHEIIVIDDGSKDGTVELLKKYGDKIRWKTIPNGGCGNARNEGVKMATGDLLAFLDADDLWFSKKLKLISEAAQRFPEAGFFCSNYIVYSDPHGRIVRHYDHLSNRREFNFDAPLRQLPLKLLSASNFVGTPSACVVRRELFEQAGGFDPECRIVEDLDFFLRAAVRTRFVIIGQPLLYKHDHEQNMSSDKIKIYEGHRAVLLRNVPGLTAYIEQHGLKDDFALGLADVHYKLGGEYYNAGQRKKAFGLFWEALRTARHPMNVLPFVWAMTKKTLRSFSGGLISRKNWRRLFGS